MAKRSVTAQVEETQLRHAGRYLKTRHPTETVKAALDFVVEKAAHEQCLTTKNLDRRYVAGYRKIPEDTQWAESAAILIAQILPTEDW
jgi:hypothetical protein